MTETTLDIGSYWKIIADTVDEGLLIFDTRGRFVAANAAAERLTGYAEADLQDRDCRILNCTGCRIFAQGEKERWCMLFAKGRVRSKQCSITRRDGRIVHLMKSGTVLKNASGEVVGVVETLTDMSRILRQQQEIDDLRRQFHLDGGYHGIIGNTPVMRNLFELIEIVSRADAPVLIMGESGTGKELVARAIHDAGPRRDKPFIKVNCAALNDSLLESELFGHVKGAFTGADRNRIGRFEAAHEGSIFLDEIGDIPLSTQIKLLRVLEDKKIERVGDHQPIPVDVRIITATHKHLEHLIRREAFREDLYFRINVFPLYCPKLSERREDIPMMTVHFIRQNAKMSGKRISGVTPEVMGILMAWAWPGNVRELRNVIEYAAVLCPGGDIDKAHLPPRLLAADSPPQRTPAAEPVFSDEKDALLSVLRASGWNQSEAARRLGVSRVTVWKRMRKCGIRRPV